MLVAPKRKSCSVLEVERIENSLILKSERGMLRIKPQTENMLRVTYTERECFANNVGIGISNEQNFADWTYEENEKFIFLKTKKLLLKVNKITASLAYYDDNGKLLFSEKDIESRELESFNATKTIVDENTKIEEIDTPDGVKRVIKEATTVFDKELYRTRLNFKFQDDEKIFGLGQAEEGVLNLRGSTQYIHQANMKIAIPFILSSAGYGILFSTSSTAIFEDSQYGSYFFTEADLEMDFYFIAGENFDKIIHSYRFLTGKATMLPKWAYGFLQSQERYETQDEIIEVAKGYRDRKIGIDCIILDWQSWVGDEWGQKSFDKERFYDPQKMTDDLHSMNMNFMISVMPVMREICANYNEFLDANLLLPAGSIYDAFNDEARKMFWKQAYEGLFKYGVDAWWCDGSEPFDPEWAYLIKPSAARQYCDYVQVCSKYMDISKINAFGLFHSMTMYEGQKSVSKEKRVMNLTRSSYIGGQKYSVVLWSGDIAGTWDVFKNQIVAGLNLCVCGLPYWTLDIGGFFTKRADKWFWNSDYELGMEDLGYQEMFVRWYQYGAFLPVFRSHGTDTRRELWNLTGENSMFYEAALKANQIRYSLIAYIYSLAAKVHFNDSTIMRMLAFDFMNDPKAMEIKDQYMFGDILVCPITEAMYYNCNSVPVENHSKTKKIYLPKGAKWFDYYSNKVYDGGENIIVDAPIDIIPLFVKAGSIIPKTEALENTSQLDNAKIQIHVYSGKDCEFNLYLDSGNAYGYENGEYEMVNFKWNEEKQELKCNKKIKDYEIIIH